MPVERELPDGDAVLVLTRGALGDVLIAWPFIAALPTHFGVRGIGLAANPVVIELLGNQPPVVSARNQQAAEWSGLYRQLPELNERLVAYIRSHRAAVVFSSRDDDPAAEGLTAMGLPVMTVPVRSPAGQSIHLQDYMFQSAGVEPLPVFPRIIPGEEESREAEKVLERLGLVKSRWLAIHPGSGAPAKNLPLPVWVELARRIRGAFGWEPVFLLGPADDAVAAELEDVREAPPLRIVRNLPLPVLAGLLSTGRGYAGHDSGVTHLAALLGLPVLAVFGPTDPACWAPRGPRTGFVSADREKSGEWRWPDIGDIWGRLSSLLETERA